MTYRRSILSATLVSSLLILSGCPQAQQPTIPEGDPGLLQELVMATAADWMDKEKFDQLYAQGAALNDKAREAFKGKSVSAEIEKINITGDSATMEVVVTTFVNFEPEPVTVTWEAQKEGDTWKLKTTPIK